MWLSTKQSHFYCYKLVISEKSQIHDALLNNDALFFCCCLVMFIVEEYQRKLLLVFASIMLQQLKTFICLPAFTFFFSLCLEVSLSEKCSFSCYQNHLNIGDFSYKCLISIAFFQIRSYKEAFYAIHCASCYYRNYNLLA